MYSLINPEDRFDLNNTQITGLSYNDIKTAPNFKDYWNKISELFEKNIVIGHNVIYDLNVISKSLERYDIEMPEINYYCTLKLLKENMSMESYSLDKVSEYLEIELTQHHNALKDASATQQIFEYLNKNYDIGKCDNFRYECILSEDLDSKLETNINSLYGIIQGITYDGIIDDKEVKKIRCWVEENRLYKHYSLFNKIITKFEEILDDNIITDYEKIELLALVSSINKSKMYSEATLALQILNGILDGIVCNEKISQREIDNLRNWLEQHNYLKDVYPYDKVLLEVSKVLEDKVLSSEESNYLLGIFEDIVNPQLDNEENINFNGKTFCLTGEFKSATKQEISQRIQNLGGIEKAGVSSKLNYLIVGGVGSDAWKFGKIGGKQAKAQELNEKGANIKIIDEEILKL